MERVADMSEKLRGRVSVGTLAWELGGGGEGGKYRMNLLGRSCR